MRVKFLNRMYCAKRVFISNVCAWVWVVGLCVSVGFVHLLWAGFIMAQAAKLIWRELRQHPQSLIRCIIRRGVVRLWACMGGAAAAKS